MSKKSLINDDFKRIFGNRVKEARKSKGLSQEILGDLVYVSKPTISKYEKGLVAPADPEILQRLADVLDVSLEYLTGDSEFKNGNRAIFDKVDCNDYLESKKNDEVRRIRRFISYINDSKAINTLKTCTRNKSIIVKEIYSIEDVYFDIQMENLDDCDCLNISMHTRRASVQKIREQGKVKTYRGNLWFYPEISPTGTDNYLYPTHIFHTKYVNEDIFLEYLYHAKSIEHYVEIVSFERPINHILHDRSSCYIHNSYRVSFSEFKKQVIDIYGITVDMLLLANKYNMV